MNSILHIEHLTLLTRTDEEQTTLLTMVINEIVKALSFTSLFMKETFKEKKKTN